MTHHNAARRRLALRRYLGVSGLGEVLTGTGATEGYTVRAETSADVRFESATVVLLGLVALLTAWAAFQSSVWSGSSLDHYTSADLKQSEAAAFRESSQALAQEDQAVLLEYLTVLRGGDAALAGFIKNELMARRAREAVEAWEKAPAASRNSSPLSEAYGYGVPGRQSRWNV